MLENLREQLNLMLLQRIENGQPLSDVETVEVSQRLDLEIVKATKNN